MSTILILVMTMGMLIHVFQKIYKSKNHLMKYISQVGGKKSPIIQLRPTILIPFLTIHGMIGIIIGYIIFRKENEGFILYRLFFTFIVTLSILLILFIIYFCVVVIAKEIICMKDTTINFILLYSLVSCSILIAQITHGNIEYPKGFLWISAVLYIVNLFGIGRIIWIIFKKKILVKSIWSIAFMNITFVVMSLSNIAFEIQHVYSSPCYSRVITSWGDALYFVVITFFTVGYGDLYPVCEITKILTMIIILSGFTFTAVFVSAALSTTIEHFGNMEKK